VRVLGIDPGSECTGWGVVEGDANGQKYRLVEFGAVRLKSSATFSSRLLKISQALDEVITRLRPDACAIEAGAEVIRDDEDNWEIINAPDSF
jgi:crossover junction endodeoxyribonuclease RuvC